MVASQCFKLSYTLSRRKNILSVPKYQSITVQEIKKVENYV